jgi:mono/diheme cytochrome c family protein
MYDPNRLAVALASEKWTKEGDEHMKPNMKIPVALVIAGALGTSLWACLAAAPAATQEAPASGKFYRIVDGKVDQRTYEGFRRYHGGCNHCHGPAGAGSTFAPALAEKLPGIDDFRRVVNEGRINGDSVMRAFGDDPNVAPYIDDIYAYLQARADGALGPGRPVRQEN